MNISFSDGKVGCGGREEWRGQCDVLENKLYGMWYVRAVCDICI